MFTLEQPHIHYIVTLLFTAHILGDFVFQTKNDAAHKRDLAVLIKHSLMHAVLAYVICGMWSVWLIPVVIFVTHGLIDWIKDELTHTVKKPISLFIYDQAAHIAVILVLVYLINIYFPQDLQIYWVENLGTLFIAILLFAAGIILILRAGGVIIGMAVQPYLHQMQIKNEGRDRGLEDGGKMIGYLERLLIFLFIFMNMPIGIGFLITAKSVFRFGEVSNPENRKEAEYIIIGTLMSFVYAIVVGYAIRWYILELLGMS